MFRFWATESRGSDRSAEPTPQQHMSPNCLSLAHDVRPASATASASPPPGHLKRKRSAASNSTLPPSPTTAHDSLHRRPDEIPNGKRIKCESNNARPRAFADSSSSSSSSLLSKFDCTNDSAAYIASPPSSPLLPVAPPLVADPAAVERVKDIVQYQFGLEILLKHKELRLIEQEMAKCQIALEQLRRCHLIPYPTACPTPDQMLDIASGRGAAVRPRPGAVVPKWAAPFGVVDGPYARHYAKWLIPDPVFDGPLPNWPGVASSSARSKSAATAEARATRNSLPDTGRGRPTRGLAGQKLHALSNGYPQPKDKAGPCVLKRSDGKVVKLVCIDCHRENFSSTQGFINHCRIAHKRDFKSHEEAAVHCGHPIEAETVPEKKNDAQPSASHAVAGSGVAAVQAAHNATAAASAAAAAVASLATPPVSFASCTSASAVPGHVYPLARNDTEAVNSLLQRIGDTFKQCTSAATVPVKTETTAKDKATPLSAPFVGSNKTPFLSRFMQARELGGNLQACVEDAKEVMDLDADYLWCADQSDECTPDPSSGSTPPPPPTTAKRMPARQAKATTSLVSNMDGSEDSENAASRRSSSQSVSSTEQVPFGGANVCAAMEFAKTANGHAADTRMYDDDEMDADLSPNTIASNNAPSLVSDDGEYDDSDDGSASETSDTDLESMSDVAEINMDEDEEQAHDSSRPLRHHRTSAGSAAAIKLTKHVTFVGPVTGPDNVDQQQ